MVSANGQLSTLAQPLALQAHAGHFRIAQDGSLSASGKDLGYTVPPDTWVSVSTTATLSRLDGRYSLNGEDFRSLPDDPQTFPLSASPRLYSFCVQPRSALSASGLPALRGMSARGSCTPVSRGRGAATSPGGARPRVLSVASQPSSLVLGD